MRLPDENDDQGTGLPLIYMLTGVTLFILFIFVLVLFLNRNTLWPKKRPPQETETSEIKVEESKETEEKSSAMVPANLTADQLDIWDMYPEETGESETDVDAVVSEPTKEDPSTDGKHTLLKYADGTEEWIVINNYLAKNDYDFSKLVCQSNIMKYYKDSELVSYMGVDISKYQDYVDFEKLKKAGVQFVMLRLGARGYESGTVTVDDYYDDNMKRATDSGLNIGVYFYSQAITLEEASQEADFVIEKLQGKTITYPVAFVMENIENDTSRIDNLSKDEKTMIARTFLKKLKEAGFKTMLYGNKEWLIKSIDLSKVAEYDIWLSQSEDIPDYPYQFSMWQYSKSASIDGIAGVANLDISFIDYTAK